MMKRAMDVMFSALGLLLLLPCFLLIMATIKMDSRGPILFRHQRVGRGGVPFMVLKFRTMKERSSQGPELTLGDLDSRITPVGRFLRKYKLDELPQLMNVLKGDMSLVGPRPEVRKFVDLYNEQQMKILSVRPGITDYASIRFRHENKLLEGKSDPINFYIEEIMPVKLRLNLDYISNRTFWTDLKVILLTFISIFKSN